MGHESQEAWVLGTIGEATSHLFFIRIKSSRRPRRPGLSPARVFLPFRPRLHKPFLNSSNVRGSCQLRGLSTCCSTAWKIDPKAREEPLTLGPW